MTSWSFLTTINKTTQHIDGLDIQIGLCVHPIIQISLSDVVGSGKDGRVLKEDIILYLESKQGGLRVG